MCASTPGPSCRKPSSPTRGAKGSIASARIRLPRRAARVAFAGHQPADRRLRSARAASADQLPQVRAAQRRARRLGLELAVAGQASRPADAAARLDLLAVRGHAFRDAELEGLRRRRRDLVRRLRPAPTSCCRSRCASCSTTRTSTSSPPSCSTAWPASLAEFDALSKRDFVLFFEPPSLDERIVNQFALFSLPSAPELQLEDLLKRREATYRRIIIPASLKWEVRDKLDQANITERVLFPGLDGLSAWLKRYFANRT